MLSRSLWKSSEFVVLIKSSAWKGKKSSVWGYNLLMQVPLPSCLSNEWTNPQASSNDIGFAKQNCVHWLVSSWWQWQCWCISTAATSWRPAKYATRPWGMITRAEIGVRFGTRSPLKRASQSFEHLARAAESTAYSKSCSLQYSAPPSWWPVRQFLS